MNVGILGVWIILIFLTFLLVYLISLYNIRWSSETEAVIVKPSTSCSVPPSTVPSVLNNLCCYVGTTVTASKYSPQLNLVVNPVAIPYLPVCQGFCSSGVLPDGVTCVGGVGQANFNQCMKISTPKDCNSVSMPVAYSGNTPYYPRAATELSCTNTGPC